MARMDNFAYSQIRHTIRPSFKIIRSGEKVFSNLQSRRHPDVWTNLYHRSLYQCQPTTKKVKILFFVYFCSFCRLSVRFSTFISDILYIPSGISIHLYSTRIKDTSNLVTRVDTISACHKNSCGDKFAAELRVVAWLLYIFCIEEWWNTNVNLRSSNCVWALIYDNDIQDIQTYFSIMNISLLIFHLPGTFVQIFQLYQMKSWVSNMFKRN